MKSRVTLRAIFLFFYHFDLFFVSVSCSSFRWNNVGKTTCWKIANFPVMHSFRAVISPASSSPVMHFLVTQFHGVNFPTVNSSLRILSPRTCFVTGFLVGSARDPRFLGSFSSGVRFSPRESFSLVARVHLFPIFSRSPLRHAFFYYSLSPPVRPVRCIFSLVSQIFSSYIKFFSLHRFFPVRARPFIAGTPRLAYFFPSRFCLHYQRIFIIKKISGVPSLPRPLAFFLRPAFSSAVRFSSITQFHNSQLCISTLLIFRRCNSRVCPSFSPRRAVLSLRIFLFVHSLRRSPNARFLLQIASSPAFSFTRASESPRRYPRVEKVERERGGKGEKERIA